jgi:hypothetical protein
MKIDKGFVIVFWSKKYYYPIFKKL